MLGKKCVDFYGERLNIGDEVIPIIEEALIIGISGIVSEIEYNETYNSYYITITDKEGNVLLNGVNAKYYSTQERYDERENQEYVYSLSFYNKDIWPMTSLPLTNKTNPNYEFPDGTCFVTLDAMHHLGGSAYSIPKIYYFINEQKAEIVEAREGSLYYSKKGKPYYLKCVETSFFKPIGENYRIFKNFDELKKYVKELIRYFNNADLTYVNNNEIFDNNPKGKEFEENLIRQLEL